MANSDKLTPIQQALQWDGSAQSLAQIIKQQGWGDPSQNLQTIIPTGLGALDQITYGLMPALSPDQIQERGGDFWLLDGREGERKSTIAANIILHAARNQAGVWIGLESAEPGMSPGRWRDILICQLATYYIIFNYYYQKFSQQGLDSQTAIIKAQEIQNWDEPPAIINNLPDVGISPEFLRFRQRTPLQQKAITWAIDEYSKLQLRTYGPFTETGGAADLTILRKRWTRDIIERNERIKIVDHLQTIQTGPQGADDYHRMQVITDFCLEMINQYGIAIIMLSQIGLTSERLRLQGLSESADSRGGSRAKGLASINLRTIYDDPQFIQLRVEKTRRSGKAHLTFPIEPASGLIIGPGEIIDHKRKKGAIIP